ncbi:His Kinase A domain containing protein [Tulasnella sp. JGI-2019a]|nr:His Kinase A domain containing protein [Tulasnella sp. JGI-2019a]
MAASSVPQTIETPSLLEFKRTGDDPLRAIVHARPPLHVVDSGGSAASSSSSTATITRPESSTPIAGSPLVTPGSPTKSRPPLPSETRAKRKPIRKLQRPSTAPAASDDASRPSLLPSAPSSTRLLPSSQALTPRLDGERQVYGYSVTRGRSQADTQPDHGGPSSKPRLSEAVTTDLARAVEDMDLGGKATVPEDSSSVYPSASTNSGESPRSVLPLANDASPAEARDWDTFLREYAAGQWDPFNIPLPPKSLSASMHRFAVLGPEESRSSNDQSESNANPPDPESSVFSRTTPPTASPIPSIAMRRGLSTDQFELSHVGTFHQQLLPAPNSVKLSHSDPKPGVLRGGASLEECHYRSPPSADVLKAAATVRWAGAGVQVAPFSFPSPESELIDPMCSLVRRDSSSSRTKREGRAGGPSRQDNTHTSHTNSMRQRPESPALSTTSKRQSRESIKGSGFLVVGPPSASTCPSGTVTFMTPPLRQTNHFSTTSFAASVVKPSSGVDAIQRDEDYFARPVSSYNRTASQRDGSRPSPSITRTTAAHATTSSTVRVGRAPDSQRSALAPNPLPSSMETWPGMSEGGSNEASTLPGLTTFVNSFSACGPITDEGDAGTTTHIVGLSDHAIQVTTADPAAGSSRPMSTTIMSNSNGEASSRYTKVDTPGSIVSERAVTPSEGPSEMSYAQLGYLAPPYPPDETLRRQALHRYSILHTAQDVNFDRVAHLAKLVFGAKMVVITLIDGAKQWHKSESGLGAAEADRTLSLCAHTILQRGDEPMVILDATMDWRFRGNPLVDGPPNIRFYAGAPLRTMEGYNLGTLCVLDDVPRSEFSPRSRHTLKEFAAIIMRELELWRDRIQLRIRDRIQRSMEMFTRECLEMVVPLKEDKINPAAGMQRVYQQAATLVKETLSVDGALLLDVSHFEVMEGYGDSDAGDREPRRTVFYHADLYEKGASPSGEKPTSVAVALSKSTGPGERSHEFCPIPSLPVLGSDEPFANNDHIPEPLTGDDHAKLSKFLTIHPNGKIYERLPSCFRSMMPANIQYAMIVPIFDVDRRPLLLLCAYTLRGTTHYMEGYELQFLRAVGVIILSAVLKRRMVLADTAKSLFISNISHELRTPLHGILASAELLHDTRLTNTQMSFLKTVKTCATSLVETVNHVLDFTKLSGKAHDGGKQVPIKFTKLDLKCLVDEIVEGCWLGARARVAAGTEEIGGVYAPPQSRRQSDALQDKAPTLLVETVIDISHRPEGWWVMSDAGGIRRILMNLIGNSIKFTTEGFIHVRLRELPNELNPGTTMIEIAVHDSGKGISKDFLQNRMFQPFSQENPLQTGTGLGLAIVNSIGTSLGGKVEVWSAEGVGTEIRLVTEVNVAAESEPGSRIVDAARPITVSMIGFDADHKGTMLLKESMNNYLVDWWGFTISGDQDGIYGEILLVNEDAAVIEELIAGREFMRPVVLLSAARGDSRVAAAIAMFERLGGWCRLVFKPSGPVRLGEAFSTAVHQLDMLRASPASSASCTSGSYRSVEECAPHSDSEAHGYFDNTSILVPSKALVQRLVRSNLPSSLNRLRSEEHRERVPHHSTGHRSSNHATTPLRNELPAAPITDGTGTPLQFYSHPEGSVSTLDIGEDGSVMLKSVVGSASASSKPKVLVVDDNVINRNLLAHWLSKRDYEFQQASDGQEARSSDLNLPLHCSVILMDLSMPHKNGFEASQEIRKIERTRRRGNPASDIPGAQDARTKVFALTGLASIEDKRKAFAAGVDGYLIKPVSLKTLEGVFQRLRNG